jgi:DNA-binding protein HU-beta
MNKNDVVRYVSKKTNFTQENAAIAVTAVYEALSEGLKNGEKMIIQGVGSFTPVTRAARAGRNPLTGEEIQIPERKAYKFKPATVVKESLNEK